MPISKNGKPYFTEEQFKTARFECSALLYALENNYSLKKNGIYYYMTEHDSFVFSPNGTWYWNSESLSGGAIEFLMQIEHKSLVEAVLTLVGENAAEKAASAYFHNTEHSKAAVSKSEFVLPEKAKDFKRLFGYLIKERGLNNRVIADLVQDGKIYLSEQHNNAVFVSYDKEGTARAAFSRGTLSFTEKPFKRDVVGSDKSYPFHISAKGECKTLLVFEGAIDAISDASIALMQGEEYTNTHRIATGGIVNFTALDRFLDEHKEISKICICFDNDYESVDSSGKPVNHGQEAAAKWKNKYESQGYVVEISSPEHKDRNDDLKAILKTRPQYNNKINTQDYDLER